ncbi:hypothetical protein TWF102_003682 [Orbilia oligospora]|uniref:C3H1-type domain-containing protein n=1 Tax=Orbilia oligospora TaxID=2813651 RepID=A0A7C8JPZ0_ORBOL|nr:hypothetical protein TWF102_003682 [Orbilia oligospora]KAF3105186.1 hypothetical protein TWF103_006651 [Orbilia oligospora]KAF3106117.1 hypothetical protein TWF706_003503 [Orbilia oligospora]KAF3131610.1 hypothetical protein TWF703_007621 [Orbilia oligospora]KAF3152354.1 hypothetical protein TWF594_004050 [Orbilia oligospora]
MASSINVNRPGRFSELRPRACKYFSKGQCTRGDSCQYYHETPPTDSSPGLRIVEIELSDLESLNSAELEAFNLEDDGPISLSELHPESIAYKIYQHPPTLSTQILNFKDQKSYSKSRLTPAYTHLQFGSGFQVTDSHIQDLLSCPSMLKSLEVFAIKGVDGSITTTGKGKKKKTIVTDPKPIEISNEPLITVIRQLRSLRVLHLIGCTKLDDYVFKAIAQSCPDLMELKLTGTPTHPGNLTDASPVYIVTKGPAYLPSIRQIHLQNQNIHSEGITLLSDARPLANILEGVQSTLPSKGAGLTLTSLEGIRVHHSSYVVALGEKKLKFKECFAPNWDVNKGEQPNEEAIEKLLAGVKELPGFWRELEEPAKEAKVKRGQGGAEWGTDGHSEEGEGEDGIHHLEIVKGGESESQKLSDNLILDLTDPIKRLHRDIADIA